MRNLSFLLSIVAAACGGVRPDETGNDAGPDSATGSLRLDPTTLDFGDVAIGGGRTVRQLTVANDSVESGTVVAAATGPDAASFGVVKGCEAPLAPGESCTLDLFAETSHQGAHAAIVDVGLASQRASATLGANGVAAQLTLSATSDDFGDVGIGTAATRTYTLTNATTVALEGIMLVAAGDAALTVDTTTCTASLAAGGTCDVTLKLVPTALGRVDAMVTASASAGASATLTITGRGTAALTVTRDGTGNGSVTGGPIDCGQTCSAVLGAPVTLTATPAAGSRFLRWNGAVAACGTNPTCNVPLATASVAAVATFADLPTLFVHVTNGVNTIGIVTVTPPSQPCANDCTFELGVPTTVTLVSSNQNDGCTQFVSWADACSFAGRADTCTLNVTADTTVTALFRRSAICDF
jgi:hypothetical protein